MKSTHDITNKCVGQNFAALNELMPHPIYGWMSWVQVLSPTRDTFDEVLPFLLEAHQSAVKKFNKKIAKKPVIPNER